MSNTKLPFYTKAPFLRREGTRALMSAEVLVALLPLCFMAWLYYGVRAVIIILISATAAYAASFICSLCMRRRFVPRDLTSVVTGVILALLLPASVPYWVPVFGSAFAIAVAKCIFGGTGRNTFNPAAAGFVFLTFLAPSFIFTYPRTVIFGSIPLDSTPMITAGESITSVLHNYGMPNVTYMDAFLGRHAGPMGTTSIIIVAASFVILSLHHHRLWQTAVPFVAVVAVCAILFPRSPGTVLDSLVYELCGGSVLFCAMFMATDPVTSPSSGIGRLVYGIGCGIITVIFRRYGINEQGAPFAILLMNSVTPILDILSRKKTLLLKKYRGVPERE